MLAGEDCNSRIYNFTGSQVYSFDDVAEAITELSGKQVSYTALGMEDYKREALEKGVPQHAVEMMAPFYTDIQNGQGNMVTTDLENALGRKLPI